MGPLAMGRGFIHNSRTDILEPILLDGFLVQCRYERRALVLLKRDVSGFVDYFGEVLISLKSGWGPGEIKRRELGTVICM